ncbi:S8 family serine peptidase [candidate division KSB1 bacterium]|nr:S8 family serine peptidase [candidate division KSB1 bacterium]
MDFKKLIPMWLFPLVLFCQHFTPSTWLYDQNSNRVDDRIEQIIEGNPDSLISMIVDLGHRPTDEDSVFLDQYGRIEYIMQYIPSVVVTHVQASRAHDMTANLEEIVMIEWDEPVYALLDVSAYAIQARSSTDYPNSSWGDGVQGQGINIAILDTGVDDGHPSLDDMDDNADTKDPKYVAGYDAITNKEINPDDDNYQSSSGSICVEDEVYHGTHVAGIALGTGGASHINSGIAPEAKLIDVKVVNKCGYCVNSSVIKGIEWCIKNRNTKWKGQPSDYHGIDIINMSLGTRSASDGQDAQSRVDIHS